MDQDPSAKPMTTTACICQACGQKVRKLNPHRMDASKVKTLIEIATISRIHGWAKIQQDSHLIKHDERDWTIQTDAVHASRLCWFGLIERKEERSGLYRLSEGGRAFLYRGGSVPAVIWCKEGRVVETSQEVVQLKDVRDVVLDKAYWDEYAALQKAPPNGPLDLFGAAEPDEVRYR